MGMRPAGNPHVAVGEVSPDSALAQLALALYQHDNDLASEHDESAVAGYPKTKEELQAWIKDTTGWLIPSVAVCPEHDAPLDFMWDVFCGIVIDALVLANRGGGKTLAFALLHLANARWKPGHQTSHFGAIEHQAKRAYKYYRAATRTRQLQRFVTSSMLSETVWRSGSGIEILPATDAQSQGGHPNVVCVDEVESAKAVPYENTKAMPLERTLPDGSKEPGQHISGSTRSDAAGLMAKALADAEKEGSETAVFEWCLSPDSMIATPTGERRLDQIRAGDQVWSWAEGGFRIGVVSWAGMVRVAPTIDIELNHGRTVRCTPDHKILTTDGWKEARDAHIGTELRTLRRRATPATPLARDAENRDVPSLLGQIRDATESLPLSLRHGDQAAVEAMSPLLSQRDGGAQSPASHAASGTEGVAQGRPAGLEGRTRSERTTDPTRRSVRDAGADGHLCPGFRPQGPPDCGRSVRRLLAQPTSAGSARCSASRGSGGCGAAAPGALGKRDASVVVPLGGTDRVVSIRPGPTIPVYDLTVPGVHNFVANGVVVHNCVFDTMAPCELPEGHPFWEWLGPDGLSKAGGWRSLADVMSHFRRVDRDTWIAQYLNKKPNPAALIYSKFGERNITTEAAYVKGAGPVYLWYDWGFSDDSVFLFVQGRRKPIRFNVFHEIIGHGKSEREWVRACVRYMLTLDGYAGPTFAEWLKTWQGAAQWPDPWPSVWPEACGDPSAPQLRFEFREHGVGTQSPRVTKHKVVDGQDVLRAAILTADGHRALYVHPDCVGTIAGFENLRARRMPDGRYSREPDPSAANHRFSHACDAARYGMWRQKRALGLEQFTPENAAPEPTSVTQIP